MIEYWTALTIGLMMIISPWVLGFFDISLAKWCNILLGLVLVVVNAWKLFGKASAPAISIMGAEPQKRKRRVKNNIESQK
jgi:hypothetical protein